MYEMKLSDLRSLAKYGNATVKLDERHKFKICEIKRDGIYIPQNNAMIGKRRASIKLRESFPKAYAHILTVKLGQTLIAERKKGKLIATWKYEQMLKERKRQSQTRKQGRK
jgi:hypothetical protein